MHFFSEFLVTFFLFLVSKRIFLHDCHLEMSFLPDFGPGPLWTKQNSPPRCFQPSTSVDISGFFPIEKAVTGRLPALESKCGSARSGQLGWTTWQFLGNWVFWSSGKLEMMDNMTWMLPSFCMIFLPSHLETLRTCFWKKLSMCKLHHRFSVTAPPKAPLDPLSWP